MQATHHQGLGTHTTETQGPQHRLPCADVHESLKVKSGRSASRFPTDGAAKLVEETLLQALPQGVFKAPEIGHDEMFKAFAFCCVQGEVCSSHELEWLASLRYVLSGTRKIVAAHINDVLTFMSGKQVANPTIAKARTFFRTGVTGMEGVVALCNSMTVFYATVTEGDVIYMPMGYLFLEKVTDERDLLGVCIRGVVPDDKLGRTVVAKAIEPFAGTATHTVARAYLEWLDKATAKDKVGAAEAQKASNTAAAST